MFIIIYHLSLKLIFVHCHHYHHQHQPPQSHQLVWACFVETTHAGQGCPHLVPRACHDELLHHAGDAEDEDGYDMMLMMMLVML